MENIITQNNKDKYAETKKRWRENNKDRLKTYHQLYYIQNRDHILELNQIWHEENKRFIVYYHINKDDEILYIGSSARVLGERQSSHFSNAHSKLYKDEDYKEKWGIQKVLYQDFTDYKLTRDDLFFIEKYQKDSKGELLGVKPVSFKEDKLSRSKEELIYLSETVPTQEYKKLKKYLN